jgi:NADH-quinone oxidoreductase subunit L
MMTAFYMFRLLFVTFFGEFRGTEEKKKNLHESPLLITIPLIVLALLSIVGGWVGLPEVFGFTHYFSEFLSPIIYQQA